MPIPRPRSSGDNTLTAANKSRETIPLYEGIHAFVTVAGTPCPWCRHCASSCRVNRANSVQTVSITDYIASLGDPLIERTKLHRLLDIIVIAICVVICATSSPVWMTMPSACSEPYAVIGALRIRTIGR